MRRALAPRSTEDHLLRGVCGFVCSSHRSPPVAHAQRESKRYKGGSATQPIPGQGGNVLGARDRRSPAPPLGCSASENVSPVGTDPAAVEGQRVDKVKCYTAAPPLGRVLVRGRCFLQQFVIVERSETANVPRTAFWAHKNLVEHDKILKINS